MGEAAFVLSPGPACLGRQYPQGAALEHQPFTPRELPAPSPASPGHPALRHCSPRRAFKVPDGGDSEGPVWTQTHEVENTDFFNTPKIIAV